MRTAIDPFRSGEFDAFGVDQVLFQYSWAAKELWEFCNVGDAELAATIVRERPAVDWWQRGALGRVDAVGAPWSIGGP